MLCAQTKDEQVICLPPFTREEISQMRKENVYYCPTCKEELIVKVGNVITPHFSHASMSTCSSTGGEGEIHERGKWLLYKWLHQQFPIVQLEVYLPAIQQRPDILVSNGTKRYAIEFQYSAIPSTDIQKRTEMYLSHDITPLWILDQKHVRQRRKNEFQFHTFIKQCAFQPQNYRAPLIIFFCTEKMQFTVLHQLLFMSLTTAYAQKRLHAMHTVSWKDIFQQDPIEFQRLFSIWKRHKRTFRLQRKRAVGKQYDWLVWLYERRLAIDYLPSIIHIPVQGQLFMNVQPWDWQSRLWYFLQHEVTENTLFTLTDCEQQLAPFIHPPTHYPLLQHGKLPIYAYLQWLCLLGYIRKKQDKYYYINKPMPKLAHIEEALQHDLFIMNDLEKTYRI